MSFALMLTWLSVGHFDAGELITCGDIGKGEWECAVNRACNSTGLGDKDTDCGPRA
jgi:hypothetical protein